MVTFSPESLRNIKRFDQLVAYLRDELDWPIDTEDFDDLTFDYEPEELGIDPKNAAKIEIIKQLRPLVSNQPWGIFWIKFKPKRLPVVALRRILGQLVTKKRATAGKAGQPTWKLDDLMLISAIGEEDERQITFAHFADDSYNGLPTLRVLGWDDDDTLRKLDWVERQLKSHLTWPDGGTPNEWRMQWRQAFILRHREVPKTTKELVAALAELAQAIRKRANTAIALETEHGPLRKLHTAFQDSLIHDLSHDGFADMYAQTIAYGLLSARISRPAGLVAEDAALMVPRTNPFLRELMEEFLRIGGRQKDAPNGGIDFDELGVNDIVELLRNANMEAVIADFGRARPGEDPVIHFYEDFMKAYDAKQRVRRGIYYTPIPVVSFIVRSVDEILREEFGLPLGLADTTTWGEMKRRFDAGELPGAAASAASEDGAQADAELPEFTIPQGVSENDPFVQILDPAVGTGTFLVEVIDLIHNRMKEHWLTEGHMELELEKLWNEYVQDHLLPRLYGFELLMAPYAICHMKLGLKLAETGYRFRSGQRLRVYLTNSLEPPQDLSEMLEFVAPFLAHEARAANTTKRQLFPTVVVGNPPYAIRSSNLTASARDLVEPFKYINGSRIIEKGALQLEKNLNDDYIKFFAFASNLITRSTCGILGFITNHSYLDNPTLRGCRATLIRRLPRVSILDLHGSSARREQPPSGCANDNVFDIQQGTAVAIMRRVGTNRQSTDYREIWGTRDEKYLNLLANTIRRLEGQPSQPLPPYFLLIPVDADAQSEFARFASLDQLFTVSATGMKTHRDEFAIDFDLPRLRKRIADFRNNHDDAVLKRRYRLKDTYGWTFSKARSRIQARKDWERSFCKLLYRPFDVRWIYYHPDVVELPRTECLGHLKSGANIALLAPRHITAAPFSHALVTRLLNEMKTCSHDRGTTCFPLYLRNMTLHDDVQTTPNVDADRFKINEALVGSRIAEGILHWCYAILYSPTYRSRYADCFLSEFPRLPTHGKPGLFGTLTSLGADLVALHLLEDQYPDASWAGPNSKVANPLASPVTTFHDEGDREIRKVGEVSKAMYDISSGKGRVYINETAYFDGVPEEVWNFHIGGYQVCHKWLSDRKRKGGKNPRPGRVLTDEDIDHYQKIVVALSETIRIMAEIDEVIETHGGWPDAFITDPKELDRLNEKSPRKKK